VSAPGRKVEHEPPHRLWISLGAALVLHLAAIPLIVPGLVAPNTPTLKPTKVRLVTIDGNMVRPYRGPNQQIGALTPAERQRRAEEARRAEDKKKPDELRGQVVDLPPSPDGRAPDNAKYLSEYNSRTERETRSRNATKDYNNAMNERTVTQKNPLATKEEPTPARAIEVGPPKPSKPGESKSDAQQFALEIPRIDKRDRLALAFDPKSGRFKNREASEGVQGNSNRLRLSLGAPGSDAGEKGTAPTRAPTASDLVPPVGVLAKIAGAPANDHLEGIEEGEGTFLNSREFKYASYFNRMKRGVSQRWDPISEYRRRDPTGNIYGFRDRVTVVNVTLDKEGVVKDVAVTQTSGIDFLDREAITAFQRASPFPNPPKGLVGGDGQFTFPFGFHVEFNSRGGLDLPF
jgi:TonB family protein